MKRNKYILVGIFTFFLIIFTSILLVWQTDIFRKVQGYSITGEFQHIGGLLDGAAVRYRGYAVGHVISIKPGPEKIEVRFFVAKNIKIPINSKVKILFDGLVGENYVSIEPAKDEGLFIKDKAVLKGDLASDLANFIDLGSQNLMQSEAILTTIRKIVTNTDLIENISNIVNNINYISNQLANETKQGKISSIISNFNSSGESLNTLLANLQDENSQYSMITIQKEILHLIESLQEIEKNIANVSSQSNSNKISSILTNIDESSQRINKYLGGTSSKSLFKSIGDLNLDVNTRVLYDTANNNGYFNTNLEFKVGRSALISGLSNTYGEIKLMNFQHAYNVNSFFKTRLGIINDAEGLGIDFSPIRKLQLSIQYYNFDQKNYSLATKYKLYDDLGFELLYKKDNKISQSGIDIGLNYQF